MTSPSACHAGGMHRRHHGHRQIACRCAISHWSQSPSIDTRKPPCRRPASVRPVDRRQLLVVVPQTHSNSNNQPLRLSRNNRHVRPPSVRPCPRRAFGGRRRLHGMLQCQPANERERQRHRNLSRPGLSPAFPPSPSPSPFRSLIRVRATELRLGPSHADADSFLVW